MVTRARRSDPASSWQYRFNLVSYFNSRGARRLSAGSLGLIKFMIKNPIKLLYFILKYGTRAERLALAFRVREQERRAYFETLTVKLNCEFSSPSLESISLPSEHYIDIKEARRLNYPTRIYYYSRRVTLPPSPFNNIRYNHIFTRRL